MLIESNISLEYLCRSFVTIIKNLSNELFYGIFEYLDGCYIYQAFYNLNRRFQELITSSSLLRKIQYSSLTEQPKFINPISDSIGSYNRSY
jgi:hypothetical protein